MNKKLNKKPNEFQKLLNNIFSNLFLINNKQVEDLSKSLANIIKHKLSNKFKNYINYEYYINIDLVFFECYTDVFINIFYQNEPYIDLIFLINIENKIIIKSKHIYYDQSYNVKVYNPYIYKNNYMMLKYLLFNNSYKYNINYQIEYNYNKYKMIKYVLFKKYQKKIKQIYILYLYNKYKIYYYQKNENNKKYIHTIYNKTIINYLLNKNNINKIII